MANIGQHIFYRWSGGWGAPPAFNGRYLAAEFATDVTDLAASAPIALLQKTSLTLSAPPKALEPEAVAAEMPVVALSAPPAQIAAPAPLVLAAAHDIPAAVTAMEAPSTAVSKRSTYSLMAVPAGW